MTQRVASTSRRSPILLGGRWSTTGYAVQTSDYGIHWPYGGQSSHNEYVVRTKDCMCLRSSPNKRMYLMGFAHRGCPTLGANETLFGNVRFRHEAGTEAVA
jgi:hypothetical protein